MPTFFQESRGGKSFLIFILGIFDHRGGYSILRGLTTDLFGAAARALLLVVLARGIDNGYEDILKRHSERFKTDKRPIFLGTGIEKILSDIDTVFALDREYIRVAVLARKLLNILDTVAALEHIEYILLRSADLNVETAVVLHGSCDVLGSLVGNYLALVDNDNPVAYRLNLLQNMCRKNDRVILSERSDKVTDLDYLLGVKSDRRLVKDYYRRISDKRLRYTDTLTVAL